MFELHVADMACGGCAGKIGRAINAADEEASCEFDLQRRTVLVDSTLSPECISTVLADAGFAATYAQSHAEARSK